MNFCCTLNKFGDATTKIQFLLLRIISSFSLVLTTSINFPGMALSTFAKLSFPVSKVHSGLSFLSANKFAPRTEPQNSDESQFTQIEIVKLQR